MLIYTEKDLADEYAKKNQISIQMAARNLRYDWFEKLLKKYNLNKIVVAHNNDDKIETIILKRRQRKKLRINLIWLK